MPLRDPARTTKRILASLLEDALEQNRELRRQLTHEEIIGRSMGRREERLVELVKEASDWIEGYLETDMAERSVVALKAFREKIAKELAS